MSLNAVFKRLKYRIALKADLCLMTNTFLRKYNLKVRVTAIYELPEATGIQGEATFSIRSRRIAQGCCAELPGSEGVETERAILFEVN